MTTANAAAVDRIEDRYRIRFAGHPRVTRDPEELEKILADLEQLATDVEPELTDRVANLRELYGKELVAIQAAIGVPFAVPAARYRMWSDLTMSRYARKFAGQDRRTRDVALLDEFTADLQRVRADMVRVHTSAPDQKLDEYVASVDRALGTYRTEAEAIRTSRRSGTLGEQHVRWAQLANAQFETYAIGFAGQTRLSRHPAALERIIRALEEIRRGMQALKLSGFADLALDKNMVVVDDRLRQYREEAQAIATLREQSPIEQRIGALAQGANDVFAMYREHFAGKPRASADPVKIDELFERLWQIAREMDAIDSDHDDDSNARNLRLVTDSMLLYAKEWEAIKQARG